MGMPMSSKPQPHPHSESNDPTIEECGLDWLEVLAIEVIRWICDSYSCPSRSGWETAIARSEAVLGTDDGPRFFAAVAALMVALRRGRRSGFFYASPHCAICCGRLLPHEHDLLLVLRAGRRADSYGIDAHALLLLEGQDTTAIRSAALRLGAVITDIDGRMEAFNRDWHWPEPRPLPPGTGLEHRTRA